MCFGAGVDTPRGCGSLKTHVYRRDQVWRAAAGDGDLSSTAVRPGPTGPDRDGSDPGERSRGEPARVTRRTALPSELRDGGFSVHRAREAGVSASRLRAKDLIVVSRGARVHHEHTFAERCRAVLGVLDECAFASGTTAAIVHGLPVPPRHRDSLEVGIPAPNRAVRRRGVTGRSLRIDESDITTVSGLRITKLARTWTELARTLDVHELVAAGDVAVRRIGLDALTGAAHRHPDRRIHPKLAAALELLDPASESPKESELRALIVLGGLPRPRANVTLRDASDRFVARVDLVLEEYHEVLEYHGDHHRTDRRQWRRDRTRESEIEALGYHVTEVTQADLDDPDALVRRLATILRRKGWNGETVRSRWYPAARRPRA